MQKTRPLMDENSVSFQIFLILLSFTDYTWFRKPNFCVQAMSKQYSDVWGFFFGGGGSMRISQNLENFIRHFARFNFSRLSLAFISKYYPIVHKVKR